MPYGAGDLRQRVTFAKPADAIDEWGNVQQGWSDQFTVWCNITPHTGGEQVMAARLTGRQPVTLRVRRTPDTEQIKTDWKATTGEGPTPPNVEYNIRSVIDPLEGTVEHGKWIDCLAEAGVPV